MKHLLSIILTFLILMTLQLQGVCVMDTLNVKLNFSQVPREFTCLGKDISPEIDIGNVNAKSLAIILDDPDAPRGTFTHWIMWNINPVSTIPKGIPNLLTIETPIVAVQGVNSGGEIGYTGPCPPPGKPHRYFFRIYGLDIILNLKAGSRRVDLENAMEGHILQQGEAMATFGR